MQGWVEALAIANADGAALTNTTTATSLLPATAKVVLPAQFLDKAGKGLRLRLIGRMSTLATTPGTFTFDVRFGATIVYTGGALVLNTTAQTNATFFIDLHLVSRSIGSGTAATIMGTGIFQSRVVIGSPAAGVGASGQTLMPDTAPVVGTGFDSTTAQTIDVFGTWSTASVSNTVTVHQFIIEAMN